jgi:hypothetical protein
MSFIIKNLGDATLLESQRLKKKNRGSLKEFKTEEKELLTELVTLVENRSTYEEEIKIYNLFNELKNLLEFHNEKFPLKKSYIKEIQDLLDEYRIIPIVKKIEKQKKK